MHWLQRIDDDIRRQRSLRDDDDEHEPSATDRGRDTGEKDNVNPVITANEVELEFENGGQLEQRFVTTNVIVDEHGREVSEARSLAGVLESVVGPSASGSNSTSGLRAKKCFVSHQRPTSRYRLPVGSSRHSPRPFRMSCRMRCSKNLVLPVPEAPMTCICVARTFSDKNSGSPSS